VLDGDGESSGEAGDGKAGSLAVIAVADVVIAVHDFERALGEGAGILDGDEDAIDEPAGGQRTACKVGGFATTRQHGRDDQRASGAQPKTALLQIPYLGEIVRARCSR